MIRRRKSIATLISPICFVFLTLVLSGCGRSGIPVATVTGEITYRDQPLTDALVIFIPKTEGARTASGYTRDGGRFQLATSGATMSGAILGEYSVLITKVVEVDNAGNPIPRNEDLVYDPAARPQTQRARKSMIPEKYNVPSKPLLSANVIDGENHFTFELVD